MAAGLFGLEPFKERTRKSGENQRKKYRRYICRY